MLASVFINAFKVQGTPLHKSFVRGFGEVLTPDVASCCFNEVG